MLKPKLIILFIVIVLKSISGFGQDTTSRNGFLFLPGKLFLVLEKKANSLASQVDKQTEKYLSNIQKQENKIKRKLWKKDSLLANSLFNSTISNNDQNTNQFASTSYSGHLDSLSTAISFLTNDPKFRSNSQVVSLLEKYSSLQNKLNVSEEIKVQLKARQNQLKYELSKLGMVKELAKYQKQFYYYQQEINELKQVFEDPSKMEQKLLQLVQNIPAFKEFFEQNSMLASLFTVPSGNSANQTGLQTRAMVNQGIVDRFGSGAAVTQMIQQNLQAAMAELNGLKSQLSRFGTGSFGNSNSDFEIPGFKPNSQKTKSFLKRLEVGTNIQSLKARYYFPITTDIGLSLGYKINDKSIIGIGGSGKLGWGTGWNNIRFSYQGIGVRSFIDYQVKGGFFMSGGYEMNYMSTLTSVQQLRDYSSWQQSGLLGITKKYSIKRKLKGEVKLLWDFMSYRQVPHTEPILFRVGYSLK